MSLEYNVDDDIFEERSLTILYATETGNPQDTADRIAARLRTIYIDCRSYDIGEYPLVSLSLLLLFTALRSPLYRKMFCQSLLLSLSLPLPVPG